MPTARTTEDRTTGGRKPGGRPPRPWHRQKRFVIPLGIAAGFAALLVGVAVGAARQPTTAVTTARQASVAAPDPTVTVTSAAPVTASAQAIPQPTVTKTVIEYRTGSPGTGSPGGSPGTGGTTVTARFNGSGTQNTGTFTVPDDWHLSWAYWGCPDPPDNFAVTEYNSDGSMDASGVTVNELGSGRGPVATYAYGDGGTHYFSISTEGCSWSLAVVTG